MINIIVARDKYRVIGNNGSLPDWHLGSDLERFKELTTGHVVVMGRATYESIGKPLPNRKSVVISTGLKDVPEGIEVTSTYRDAITFAKKYADQQNCDIYIIGGQTIYNLALRNGHADRVLMTLVNGEFEGDTYFPSIPIDEWKLQEYEIHNKDKENSHDFAFMNFVRRQPGDAYDNIFYLPSSRSDAQSNKMLEIKNLGICPFCEDWLEWFHESPIIHKSNHWAVTLNDNPYRGTVLDLLVISRHHCVNLRDLPQEALSEIGLVAAWVENQCGINFFGLGMRVGSVEKVGGSVNHLHFHIKVGDINDPNHKPVTFKMSSRPEENRPPENY